MILFIWSICPLVHWSIWFIGLNFFLLQTVVWMGPIERWITASKLSTPAKAVWQTPAVIAFHAWHWSLQWTAPAGHSWIWGQVHGWGYLLSHGQVWTAGHPCQSASMCELHEGKCFVCKIHRPPSLPCATLKHSDTLVNLLTAGNCDWGSRFGYHPRSGGHKSLRNKHSKYSCSGVKEICPQNFSQIPNVVQLSNRCE